MGWFLFQDMGEQIANMLGFKIMARRPDLRADEIMNSEELKAMRSELSRLSLSALQQAYHTAYARCRMVNDRVPSARCVQELVQVWKQLWKRR